MATKLSRFTNAITLVGACLLAAGPEHASAGDDNIDVTFPSEIIHLHSTGHAFIVDSLTDTVVADLPTGLGGTLGSTTPDGSKVYVGAAAPGETQVTVLDLKSRSVVATLQTGNRPKHPLVSPDGSMVIVNNWSVGNDGSIHFVFIETATDSIIKDLSVPIGSSVGVNDVITMHNSWSWDSRYAYGVDRVDNQLVAIDTRDWSIVEVDLPSKPHYPVVSPDGKELWVVVEGVDLTNRPGIVVLDLTDPSLPVKATMDSPLIGEAVVEGHHGNFTQDGKYFMLLNRGGGSTKIGREVAFFDAKKKTLVRRITTASSGVGHAYNSPDGRHVMVTNYGNNVITIIDLKKKINPVADVEIGTGRMGHVAFTKNGRYGYISNAADGNLFKFDMKKFEVVKEIVTGGGPGGGQVLNVWTNVFEELPVNDD